MPRFLVEYEVTGRIFDSITADSKEDAERIAQTRVEEDEGALLDLDECTDADYSVRQLFPVTREGKNMWVTYVFEADVPWNGE